MRLTELLEESNYAVFPGLESAATEIRGLTSDSRRVRPGYLFAALPGERADGRTFIGEAIRRGAAAVLAPPGTALPGPPAEPGGAAIALITDEEPRRRLALMAARFYRRQPATVAAVTGTNGKTSVVSFLRQMWTQLGHPAASMGTLGVSAPGIETPGNLTTPDPVALHETLARLAEAGVECLAMEASSHGLEQYRLDGVHIAAAAFTNLGRDHLDYHGSMRAYLQAKRRLFAELVVERGAAVLNTDVRESTALAELARNRGLRVLTYGRGADDVRLLAVEPLPDGQRLTIAASKRVHRVHVPLIGAFQAENALCALALLVATGTDSCAAMMTLSSLHGVPGRLERVIRLAGGAAVYVDYAHTPDALIAVLKALRPHAAGQLAVVFGCGGDRDAGKRPEMGRVAAQLADRVIVTDDNPRGENAAAIRNQILAASPGAREIGDRREAIAAAIAELHAGDVLLVAGKGHEIGQIVGAEVLPFDDAAVVRAAAADRAEDR